jgi:hypothetical protein
MLNVDGSGAIADRGAGLMGGMCGMCHTQLKSKDFVFSK